MSIRVLACSVLSVLILGGCAGSGSKISVIMSPNDAPRIENCPEFEFCAHGAPLSGRGLALLDPEWDEVHAVSAEPVGLTTLGPIKRPMSSRPGVYFLGAGDSLGQSIFGTYAVFARAERARLLHEVDQQPSDAIVGGEPVGN